jgi:sialidase-1
VSATVRDFEEALQRALTLAITALALCAASCEQPSGQSHHPEPLPDPETVTVFSAGEVDYSCFRIPALLTAADGTILAFSEGRRESCRDDADIDLVLKRSRDAGRTWSSLDVLFDDGDLSVNQPAPVLDRQTGDVVLVFCKNNQRVFVTKSRDNGSTWSEPREITDQVVDPDWSYIGAGPGHGIQLSSGRLLISSWGDTSPGPSKWRPASWGEVQFSYAMYSDDHGETWQRSTPLDSDLSDESMSVETVDGRIYMNMRSRQEKRMRAHSWSEDGGQTWSGVKFNEGMPEPSVQGSVVRFTRADSGGKNRVLLAHPSSRKERALLTVRLSYDECETFPISKVLHAGSAAYSDLAIAPDMTILCLYEADSYSKIGIARFSLEWLTDGQDRL